MVSIGRPSIFADGAVGACGLGELEAVAVAAGLGDDEQAEAAVRLGAVGIGSGQQHQHVGAGAERAPRLDAVDDIAGLVVGPAAGVAVTLMPATSLPKSGSVTATAAITSAVASLGSHSLLLRFGATLDESPGEDLGSSDQRTADAQRTAD